MLRQSLIGSLNNQELENCYLVCKSWRLFLDNTKFFLLRKIQKTIETRHRFNEQWQILFKKLNTEELITLNVQTKEFYSDNENFDNLDTLVHLTTPLNWAVWTGILEIVQVIVAKMEKENLNKTPGGPNELTPLHIAALVGNLVIWNEIAMYEPDKNLETKYKQTVFEIAAVHDQPQICQMVLIWKGYEILQNDGFGIKQLHHAAYFGCLDTYKLIAAHFDDKNPTVPTDPSLETPLHLAAEKGHLELCIWIMDNLDNKSPVKSDGTTPLHIAAKSGNWHLYHVIQDKLVEKNPIDNSGITPKKLWKNSARNQQNGNCTIL